MSDKLCTDINAKPVRHIIVKRMQSLQGDTAQMH